jgi:hypothetical protein
MHFPVFAIRHSSFAIFLLLHENFREGKLGDDHFPGFVVRNKNDGKDLHSGSFLFPAHKACARYNLHRNETDQLVHNDIFFLIGFVGKGNTAGDKNNAGI